MMEFAGRLSELKIQKICGERILTLQERIQALSEEQNFEFPPGGRTGKPAGIRRKSGCTSARN